MGRCHAVFTQSVLVSCCCSAALGDAHKSKDEAVGGEINREMAVCW